MVLKEGNAEAGTDKKADDLGARSNNAQNGEAGKLFANATIAADSKKSAADAAKAVGAVVGADILQAMIKDKAKTLASTSAAQAVQGDAKDGTIAGAIALRAMAKDGKFAGPNAATAEYSPAVKGAAVSAVTKALDTLTIAIRKTIDAGLEEVKKVMKINNDIPVASEKSGSSGQNK